MKSRFNILTMSALLVLTMATGAFAQGVFRVSSGTEPRGRENGHAELAGDISMFLTNGSLGNGDSGIVMIEYGVPITNEIGEEPDSGDDTMINVSVCDTSGSGDELLRLVGTESVGGNRASVSEDGSVLTIHVMKCQGDNAQISVENVRLSLVGSGADSITASVTNSGDVRLLNNEAFVIRSVVDPLGDDAVKVAKKLTLIRHTGKHPTDDKAPTGKFMFVVEEAHVDSFKGADLRLEFEGIPDGFDVTLDGWLTTKANYEKSATDSTRTSPTAAQNEIQGITPVTVKDDTNKATVTLVGTAVDLNDPETPDNATDDTTTMLSNSAVDVVIIRGSIDGADDEDLLPLEMDIQVTVDLGPIGDKDDDDIPRFASDKTTAMTVIESTSAQTTFLVPYAVADPVSGYDTGFSIANATSGSTAQSGSVTFSFPGDSTLDEFESGMVGSGENLTMLLSEILGQTTSYSGQVMITANFTNAEGVAFVSDFQNFTSASPLVKNRK